MTKMALPNTMKAVQISRNGGTEVLELRHDAPVPKPGPGQVVVRNLFAGINFIDTYFRTGLYPAPSLPLTLGREAAGEVVFSSSSSSGIAVGTRVVYVPIALDAGTYAQYTAVDEDRVVAIPDGVGTDVAAAVFLQGLTAWTLIREAANVQPDTWTLVHAAAGGVGLLLVQMLRLVGARVIAAAGDADKRELACRNGAGWVVDSRADDLVAKVKEITGGHGVDVIFDGVGKATFDADLDMIAVKGLLISFGNASGAVPPLSLLRLTAKNIKLMRPTLNVYVADRGDLVKYSNELFDLVGSKKINVAIHNVYPLQDVARAHTDIESRKTTGKLLLDCQ
ncbi:quinone oxidoreductase [Ophiocordyceps camponoti-floridani]|uniref:Probable quinone oxidoreductase n=1 Tax=Ophiocordyceps camponoti-floridani TaxID=2030778 RepID=A0A8H4Q312_9HYPO|nr:quinone oxidoreductase [Ophiocordyceps camponoti-floridani]